MKFIYTHSIKLLSFRLTVFNPFEYQYIAFHLFKEITLCPSLPNNENFLPHEFAYFSKSICLAGIQCTFLHFNNEDGINI